MQRKKIKVLIVDDSVLFRRVLIDSLAKYEHIEIIGYAVDAFDAKLKIPKLKPDVVTMDVEMPRINGIEFIKQILPLYPVPVVIVSSLNINVFEALSAGAVDFVRKPDPSVQNHLQNFITELAGKISIASTAAVRPNHGRPLASPSVKPLGNLSAFSSDRLNATVIALGASTGGTEATLAVLKELPPDTPGILVVQHMPVGFTKMYAERLNRLCQMEVKEAQSGDKVQKGRVLIAPGDSHMKILRMGSGYTVNCYQGDKVSGHRPSVDVLFHSVAETVKQNAIGIIMTGMGRDGAAGLLEMKKSGAFTIGQDKDSCVVYGMPMVAYNIGAVTVQASLENISGVLKRHLQKIQ